MDETPIVQLYRELPDFANETNRALHAEIQKNLSEFEAIKTDCVDLTERVAVLKDHFKNVQAEVGTTQKLLTAKEAECEEEQHLHQLALRERGNIQTEMAKIEEETSSVQARWSEIQARIFKAQQRIEYFKEQSKQTEEELQAFIVAAEQKEEDNQVIKKYLKDDEGVIKKLYERLEKNTGLLEAKRAELDQEVTNTKALQIELDRTAEQFKQLHDERSQVLSQWEQTLKQTQELNKRIEESTEQFESRKSVVDSLNGSVADYKKTLDIHVGDNQSLERQITMGDNKINSIHRDLEHEEQLLGELSEAVETVRGKLSKLEGDERFYNEEIANFQNMIAQEVRKKEEFERRLKQTEDAFSSQKNYSNDFNDQIKIITQAYEDSKSDLKNIENQIEEEKKQHYIMGKELNEEQTKYKTLKAEIAGSKSRAKNLQLRIDSFDSETQKQMELLYNANFHIQQMERKISHMTGVDTSEEERIEFEKRIAELEKIEEQKKSVTKQLDVYLHRMDLDLRQAQRRKEKLETQQKNLSTEMSELDADQHGLDIAMERRRHDKEEAVVQLNMLRLQVEKLSDALEEKSDEIVSLENRREQLRLSMQERMIEIEGHIAGLRVQLKTEEEARHAAVVEVAERKKHEAGLQAKYEIVSHAAFDEDGMPVSQAETVIKIAKQRQEITQQGDALNEEIKSALHELRALERVMKKFEKQNTDYKAEFKVVGKTDADAEREKTLQETVASAQRSLQARREEARKIGEQTRAMEATYNSHQDEIEQLQRALADLKTRYDRALQDGNGLKEKVGRATKVLTAEQRRRREEDKADPGLPYPATLREMDAEIRVRKFGMEMAVDELLRIAEGAREIEPKVRLAIAQLGIKPRPQVPSLKPHMPSSGSGSGRSLSGRSGASFRSAASNASQASAQSARSGASFRTNRSGRSNGSAQSARSNNSHVSIKCLSFDGV